MELSFPLVRAMQYTNMTVPPSDPTRTPAVFCLWCYKFHRHFSRPRSYLRGNMDTYLFRALDGHNLLAREYVALYDLMHFSPFSLFPLPPVLWVFS